MRPNRLFSDIAKPSRVNNYFIFIPTDKNRQDVLFGNLGRDKARIIIPTSPASREILGKGSANRPVKATFAARLAASPYRHQIRLCLVE